MANKIIEASELPENEKIYLKKDWFGWRIVEPWRDPETNKINWFNFLLGGKKGVIWLLFVVMIVGLLYLGINDLISNYKVIAENPCSFCEDCFTQTRNVIRNISNQLGNQQSGNINLSYWI